MAETDEISCQVQRRRWIWLGNVLRREGVNDCFAALRWTPKGGRARGIPKTTWRRTVEREREEKQGGRAGMWPRQWHATRGVEQTMWQPYAPTGARSNDDDDERTPSSYMFKSHTKPTTLNAHIIIIIIITRSLVQHSLGLAHRYDPVIYACILPTVCHHS